MTIDETLLLAYVDGELPPTQRAEVETLVAGSDEAAEFVRMLRASQFDYRRAFAAQKLPPVPASLAQNIDALVQQHRATHTAANADQVGGVPPSGTATPAATPAAAPVRSRLRGVPVWLAAACVAGAFCAGLLLRTGPLIGTAGDGMSPWVAAAAGYQRLYTRDTVAYTPVDPQRTASVIDEIRAKDHLALNVPDLSSAGLQFKAIQRLNFNNKPLVQIVYLPRKGPPVSLCVIGDPKPDAAVAARTVDSMHVITWRQAKVGYALLGNVSDIDLESIGRQIAGHGTNPLFGATAGPTAASWTSPDA
ncbi:anti-sigma factor family protein [Paraburkholderia megapolitana]|uniref:anti-sigma factor family protein n=1 Tax=Paraburkholderia megapolitana TaxID=420953 RepID=UPI0038B815C9